MPALRGRPKWHYVVFSILFLLLIFWLMVGIGTQRGDSGRGNILPVSKANGDYQPDLSALVTGETSGESAQAEPDGSPCAGLSGLECETLFDDSYYTGGSNDPPQAAPPSVDPPPTVYGPSDPCAGLTGLECETLFDDTYYAPGSPYQPVDPPSYDPPSSGDQPEQVDCSPYWSGEDSSGVWPGGC